MGDAGSGTVAALATGVVGVGRVGREHARLLAALPGADLVGVCDLDPERGEREARRWGCRYERELAALLERVDAVVVAVPTPSHARVARAALESGCHVLVEKPLAASLQAADGLIELAERRGLTLRVGHVERYNPVLREAGPLLDRPRFVEAVRLAPFDRRASDVSVVLDLMIHDLDLVVHLVGSPVERVSAAGTRVMSTTIDIASARLEFACGAMADLRASRVSPERERRLRLFHPGGYVSLDLAAGKGTALRGRNGRPSGTIGRIDDVLERVSLVGDGTEPLEAQLIGFLRAARGLEARLASAREGRAALELALRVERRVEAFARSSTARTGKE